MQSTISCMSDVGEHQENIIIENYENALKAYFNAKFCLALSSGTAALMAALHAVGAEEGHEVITSPAAPLCTAYPVLSSRAALVFSDIGEKNFGLDPGILDQKVTTRTRAVIDVPMWGYATKADEIQSWARRRKLPLILDLAHCAGATYGGRSLSAYGDIACYSTQKNKMFSTGEGGYLLTDNETFYRKAFLYSKMGDLNGEDFGVNFKISHLQALAGIQGLQKLKENISFRTDHAGRITAGICHPNIEALPVIGDSTSNFQRLVLLTRDGCGGLAQYMEDNGIPSDVVKYRIKPLYEYPILSHLNGNCANAERLLSCLTTLMVHCSFAVSDIGYIVDTINRFPL